MVCIFRVVVLVLQKSDFQVMKYISQRYHRFEHNIKKITFLLLPIIVAFGCGPVSQPPAAGIALSFDDRFVQEWAKLRPLFKKYDARATFYVTQFDSLKPEEIEILRQLQADGHEIGAHGATHARSIDYVWQHSMNDYFKNEIEAELEPMKKAGLKVSTFAHPGGQQIWFIDQKLLKNYFCLLRDVALTERDLKLFTLRRPVFGMNEIYYRFDGNPTVSALLIDQGANVPMKALREGLIRAKNTNSTLMLFGHRPLFESSGEKYGFGVSRLDSILAESKKLGLRTYTMSQLIALSRR